MVRLFVLFWSFLMAVGLGEYALDLTGYAWARTPSWPQAIGYSSLIAAIISGLVFLLGRRARIVFVILAIYLALTAVVEGFIKFNFYDRGLIGEAMVATLVDTNLAEIGEFIRNFMNRKTLIFCLVGLVILIPTLAGIILIPIQRPTKKVWVIFTILEVIGLSFSARCVGYDQIIPALCDHEFLTQKKSWQVCWDLKNSGQKMRVCNWGTLATNRLVVVAIGESSSRAHWSLFGYPRTTTPELQSQRAELVIFTNCTATAYLTPFALRDSLTACNKQERVSIPSLASCVGYDTILLSAQGRWGMFDGADELLFKTCRDRVYLCEQRDPPYYDEQLVPYLLREIQDDRANQVVFMHFYGSHSNWSQRYPSAFNWYPEAANDPVVSNRTVSVRMRINAYDNSIAYTDHVLARCIAELKGQKRPSVFLYFSDHGEAPSSFNRDPNDPELFAIPLFVWLSPEIRATEPGLVDYLQTRAAKEMTSYDLFPLLLKLLAIERR